MRRFVSMDIEATGLDDEKCQILEFGAVMGDFSDTPVDKLPSFVMRFKYDIVVGEPMGLAMNADLIRDMANNVGSWFKISDLAGAFDYWLLSQGINLATIPRLTVTGKNIGSYDRRFLARVPGWDWSAYSHKFLDPGSLFFRPTEDEELPSTVLCASRAGVVMGKRHSALEDARYVVEMIRAYYRGK
jgi:oligoribonuclease (3'-5' exoribonuclease)